MKRMKIEIEGMTCSSCEKHVDKELKILGAKDIKVSHEDKSAIFTIGESVSEEVVSRAIKTAGYKPGKVYSKKVEKKGLFGRLLK